MVEIKSLPVPVLFYWSWSWSRSRSQGKKYPEPVKNGLAPQHCLCFSLLLRYPSSKYDK